MDQDMGSLKWSLRLTLQQWKSDLAEADRAYSDYKRKWEGGIAIGGGVGRSGGGAGGGAGPSVAAGGSGGGFTIPAPSGGANTVNQSTSNTVNQQYNQMNQLNQLNYQQNMSSQYSNSYTYNVVNNSGGGGGGGGGGAGNGGNIRRQLAHLVRGTIYGLVVDAIASQVGNESQFQQNQYLAGNNQGMQARAHLQRLTGGLGGIPIIGGVLNNLMSPLTTPIETNIMSANNAMQYGNVSQEMSFRRTAANFGTAIASSGPNAGQRANAQFASTVAKLRNDQTANSQKSIEAFQAANPITPERQDTTYAEFFSGHGVHGYLGPTAAAERRFMERTGYGERLNNYMRQQNSGLNADINEARQGVIQTERDQRFEIRNNTAEIHRMKYENALMPAQGLGNYENEMFSSEMSYKIRGGMTANDRKLLVQSGEAGIERLRGAARSGYENYLYGSAETYNPYIQSPIAQMERGPETQADATKALEAAIKELTNAVNAVKDAGRNN